MIYHGLEETQKVVTGNQKHFKRKKYCSVHGWIDLFMCEGREGWEAAHSKCGNAQTGAAVKVLAKAA